MTDEADKAKARELLSGLLDYKGFGSWDATANAVASALSAARREGERGWVRCSERMPEVCVDVPFVAYGNTLCFGAFRGDEWRDISDIGGVRDATHYRLDEVTHWFDIPALPGVADG